MQNKRVYLKFIVRRYLYMLGIMIVVAIPVVLLNKEQLHLTSRC